MLRNWRKYPRLVAEYQERYRHAMRFGEVEMRDRLEEMVEMLDGFYPPDPVAESQAGRIPPERAAVYQAVAIAIRRGEITRPRECHRCWKACKPHAHHRDYSRPLDVKWLCPSCHALQHVAERNAAWLASLRAEPG